MNSLLNARLVTDFTWFTAGYVGRITGFFLVVKIITDESS